MFLTFPPHGTEWGSGQVGGSRLRCTHKQISIRKCSRRNLLPDEKKE